MIRAALWIMLSGLGASLAMAQAPSVVVTPSAQQLGQDSTGQVRIRVDNIQGLHAYHVQVSYNPLVVRCRLVRFLGFLGMNTFPASFIDSANGRVTMDEAILGPGSQSGSGDLVELRFFGVANGTTAIALSQTDFRDTTNQGIVVTTQDGSIRVGPPEAVPEVRGGLLEEFKIESFPNPFNPSTTIRYSVGEGGQSEIGIYSVLGKKVCAWHCSDISHSVQEFTWQGKDMENVDVPSGVYVVQVVRRMTVGSAKVLLLR